MRRHKMLLTQGKWYDLIASGQKRFDFRKGYRAIEVDDEVEFIEADETGNPTGNTLLVRITLVVHSSEFPSHFRWTGGEFTIFQFEVIEE